MVPSKTWLAIPAVAIACAGLALLVHVSPIAAIALAGLGAAVAAAVRAFAGPSIAVAVAGSAAGLVGVLAVLELPLPDVTRAALACGAGLFAIGELVRPLPPDASPWPALGAATLAAVLDPSFAALVPVAGGRLATGPWSLPRWRFAAPVVGALIVALAILGAVAHHGWLARLWSVWAARDASGVHPLDMFLSTGDVLGPVTAVVAAAGLGVCAVRGMVAASAVLGVLAGAIGLDLVAGSTGAATVSCAALGAGTGIARFAALIRWPVGQAFVGATVGAMLVVAPVWALVVR